MPTNWTGGLSMEDLWAQEQQRMHELQSRWAHPQARAWFDANMAQQHANTWDPWVEGNVQGVRGSTPGGPAAREQAGEAHRAQMQAGRLNAYGDYQIPYSDSGLEPINLNALNLQMRSPEAQWAGLQGGSGIPAPGMNTPSAMNPIPPPISNPSPIVGGPGDQPSQSPQPTIPPPQTLPPTGGQPGERLDPWGDVIGSPASRLRHLIEPPFGVSHGDAMNSLPPGLGSGGSMQAGQPGPSGIMPFLPSGDLGSSFPGSQNPQDIGLGHLASSPISRSRDSGLMNQGAAGPAVGGQGKVGGIPGKMGFGQMQIPPPMGMGGAGGMGGGRATNYRRGMR